MGWRVRIVAFVFLLVVFLAFCIDYRGLNRVVEQSDQVGALRRALSMPPQPWPPKHHLLIRKRQRLNGFWYFLCACLLATWTYHLVGLLASVPRLVEIKMLYTKVLRISDASLQHMPWSDVVYAVELAQQTHEFCAIKKNLDVMDIVSIILQHDNFLLCMYKNQVVDVSLQLPLVGEFDFLPASLQWAAHRVINGVLYNKHRRLRDEVRNVQSHDQIAGELRYYFRLYGIAYILLCPLFLIHRFVMFCFGHSDLIQKQPGYLAARQWTPFAHWDMRVYNELPHYLHRRLSAAYDPTCNYLRSFVSHTWNIVARFFVFVLGGLFVIISLFGYVLDEDLLLRVDLTPNRSIAWWFATIGGLLAVARSMAPPQVSIDDVNMDPRTPFALMKKQFYDFVDRNVNPLNESTRVYFSKLLQLRAYVVLEEIFGLLLIPYMLFVRFPAYADRIVDMYHKQEAYLADEPAFGSFCKEAMDCILQSKSHVQKSVIEHSDDGAQASAAALRPIPAAMASMAPAATRAGPGERSQYANGEYVALGMDDDVAPASRPVPAHTERQAADRERAARGWAHMYQSYYDRSMWSSTVHASRQGSAPSEVPQPDWD
ncbi:uncharacterized protein MONBRDRAFT_28955 [Monosiga brevicollis MX1]|uniref:Autophagy-related protein 9 n=1 Tax=Monosiga brevicollis TaxID=81824 RepID=A9V9N5_MONBE|nr:uncharacterized protein MONBRDRAFT_28955 [Monosiga brevicollis MX1]EDQ85700.1 predicted protein [Monosiga brevicollis MX1]|eukprot:XP_001749415.1 hypothetical protein [Monosiga brevicollis MX1]